MPVRPFVLLLSLLLGSSLRAEPDAELHRLIRQAWDAGQDGDGLLVLADRLSPGLLLPLPRPTSPEPAETAVRVSAGELQAALTQLAILSGGNGHLALLTAQAGQTDAIHVLAGMATLRDLEAVSTLVTRQGAIWHLSRPLVIWPGAGLSLDPGQVLELDTAAGAFLLSFGDVTIHGAEIRGDGGRNSGSPAFRPFLLVSGQGSLQAENATFRNLGFQGPVAVRGVSILSAGLMKPPRRSQIADSLFDSVFSLSLEGADGTVVAGNRLSGAGAAAISVKGATGLILDGNRIEASAEGAGVRLSGDLRGVHVVANLVRNAGSNGIQVDGAASGLVLRGNVVIGNAGTGVAIRNGVCTAVQGNIIAGNGTSGLRLVGTGAVRVADNAILSNHSSAIEVEAQAGLGTILLTDNVIAANREGLRAASLGEVRLLGNDLDDQIPRQFAGDFAMWLGAYLTSDGTFIIPAPAAASVHCETE